MAAVSHQALMMAGSALYVAGSAVTNTPTASSSLTINLPSSIVAGDLLIILVSLQANGRIVSNVPTGFTLLGSVTAQSSTGEFAVFYKVAAGSEGATVSMTLGGSTTGGAVALCIRGYQGTPEIVTFGSADPSSLSPSWGSAGTLWLAVLSLGYATQPTITYPANYTVSNAESANARAAIGWRVNTAVSEDPATFVTTGGSSVNVGAATVAIRPA